MNASQNANQKKTQDLISRALSQQVRAAQRYADLLARFGRGELSAQALSTETLRFASQETGQYASDLAELSLRYYTDLFALGQAYSERFLNALEKEGDLRQARSGGSPKRVVMELRAPLGQEALGAFVLENKHGGSAQISFEVSDFSGPTPNTAFRADLRLQPERFTLEPGQEQTVTLRLPLREGVFEPGQRYLVSVIVRGYDDLVLDLTVYVDEKV
jgi:hypothetical protein